MNLIANKKIDILWPGINCLTGSSGKKPDQKLLSELFAGLRRDLCGHAIAIIRDYTVYIYSV